MSRSAGALLLVVALTLGSTVAASASPATGDGGGSDAQRSSAGAPRPQVSLEMPREAVEGDRIAATVRIGSAGRAKSVELFKATTDLWGQQTWTSLKKRKVSGVRTHRLAVVATDDNAERYRVTVTYKTGKPLTSRVSRVKVWRWIDFASFRSYYSTPGVSSHAYTSFAMNGAQYKGWQAYGTYPTWESRHTPGRNCRALRGEFGVTDSSADGSSAEIVLLADETSTVWTSSTLTPGMVETAEVPLAMPYRISIQARNTSPEGLGAYPAIGHPALLCTGI